MSWIESHQSLGGHPKKDHLAELLWGAGTPAAVADYAAIGLLHRLWWWAVDYAQDGDLARFTDAVIAKGCGWDGDPILLVASLTEARWIDKDRKLHDWDEYAGRLVEKRKQDAERKREGRRAAKNTPTRGASSGRPADAPADDPRDGARTYRPTDLLTHTSSAKPADDGFASFWTAYPRKIGKTAALKRWRAMTKRDRATATAAAEQLAAQARATNRELRFIPHPATFIGPARHFEDWVDGIPDGYAGDAAAVTKREQCPHDGTDLTYVDGVQHCPFCDWRPS